MKGSLSARQGELAAAGTPTDSKSAVAAPRGPATPAFDAATTASEVALGELRRLLGAWRQHEPGARPAAPSAAGAFGERAMVVMPERVRRRFRKLRNSVRGLRSNSPMEDYHLVRRRAKQLRYAIESGALMFGKPAEDELKALRRLQDELGAHQDAYMARNRLAALAADPANELPAGTLFLMGRLAERHATTTAQA